MKGSMSQFVFAHVVPQKGVDEKRFAADSLVEDVRTLGYNHIVLTSDKEPAIKRLLEEPLKESR